MPTCTSSATSSNAHSPCSSSGERWPPDTTSTPPSTAALRSSPQSSPGYAVRRHALGAPVQRLQEVSCHHNYTERERHFGKDVWLSRKGAIEASTGTWGRSEERRVGREWRYV